MSNARNNANVSACVDRRQCLTKNVLASFNGNVIDRDFLASPGAGGTPREVELHGNGDFAAAERRSRSATTQQDLVDVVVKDHAESISVVAAQAGADPLGNGVAKRV